MCIRDRFHVVVTMTTNVAPTLMSMVEILTFTDIVKTVHTLIHLMVLSNLAGLGVTGPPGMNFRPTVIKNIAHKLVYIC